MSQRIKPETPVKVILTDIEGTTSSISFVKDVLFPYAYEMLPSFLRQHQQQAHISQLIAEVSSELPQSEDDKTSKLDQVIQQLRDWIDTDQKKTSLKALQGYIWEAGYKNGDFKAHIYPDALECLQKWSKHYPVFVYSSGSIKAQDLFFTYSTAGNIKSLFKGFFDTTSGPKKESTSYSAIAAEIKQAPEEILFLSDCPDEIAAAAKAGLQVCEIRRENSTSSAAKHAKASDFYQVDQLFF